MLLEVQTVNTEMSGTRNVVSIHGTLVVMQRKRIVTNIFCELAKHLTFLYGTCASCMSESTLHDG